MGGVVAANFISPNVSANTEIKKYTLHLKPQQCIAVHQGKECFADVELTWRIKVKGDYCLYSSQQTKALKCWQNSNQGEFAKEVSSTTNVLFFLKNTVNDKVIISKELEMAWVYKKTSRSHLSWRMF